MKRLYLTFIIVLAILAFAGYIFWHYFYLATVTIDPIPTDATITINGQAIADRTVHLSQGTYTVTVGESGYRTQNFSVKVGVGSQVNKAITLQALPKPTKLIDGAINSLVTSADQNNLYFEQNNILYRYSIGNGSLGPAVPLTPQLANIASVDWSPDFSLALLHKTNGEVGLYDFNRYDLLHQTYTPLAAGIRATAWDSDNSGFYYEFQPDTGEHSLIKVNKAGKNPERLGTLDNFHFAGIDFVPGDETSLFLANTDRKSQGDVIKFDTHQKVILPITTSGNAYGPVISPDKSHVAYLDNGELVVAQSDGTNKRNLTLRPKANNYVFMNNATIAVMLPNQISVVSVTDGSHKDYAITAPSDAIDGLVSDSTGTDLYYVYNNALYQIKYNQ